MSGPEDDPTARIRFLAHNIAELYDACLWVREFVDDEVAVTDPLLDYVGAFFAATLNQYLAAAWSSVAPGEGDPVRCVRKTDPEDVDFIESDLPCLYLWRQSGARERIADDYVQVQDKLTALWAFPPAPQNTRKRREAFVNGIVRVIDAMLLHGRDPAWVVPGDTNERAAREGSLIQRWAGYTSLVRGPWKRTMLVIRSDSGQSDPYPALEITFDVTETLQRDADTDFTYAPPKHKTTFTDESGDVERGEENDSGAP